jgi:uroporphyrinogen III methyltransferase/synthase
MGVGSLPQIAKRLMEHGRPPKTPIAIIYRGTVPEQKTVVGTLLDIADVAQREGVKPPSIIVVGDIVNLRKDLNWFENRPLFGRRVVVTRAREQASGFMNNLSELGAECLEFPTIEIIPPRNWEALDRAIHSLEEYQWLLFTSVNGVKYFFHRLEFLGKDARDLKGVKIGAIGPKTAQAVQEKGIRPDLVPDEYRAEAVVKAFRSWDVKGAKILLPRAAQAREVLPEELAVMGARVEVITSYRTVKPDHDRGIVRGMLEKGEIDMVTFTSSSTVKNFVEMLKADSRQLRKWMANVNVACIGPITAKTATEKGLPVKLVPSDYTIEALTHAIVQHFTSPRS